MDFSNWPDPKTIHLKELTPYPKSSLKALTFGSYSDPTKAQKVWESYFPNNIFPKEAMTAYRRSHDSQELDVRLDMLTSPRSVHVWENNYRAPRSSNPIVINP